MATALALSSCAPAQVSKTVHHVGATTLPAAPTPTPTPTPLAAPVSRVSQTCSQLVPTAALTAVIGSAPAMITTATSDFGYLSFTQDGALACHWSDSPAKDQLQASNHVVAWVMPDVPTASFAQAATTLAQIGETKTTIIGGDAYGWCYLVNNNKGTFCSIDTLVGTTWLSFELESMTKAYATSNLGLTHFAALVNPIVTAAGSASFVTEPKWTDPTATTTPTNCDAALPDTKIDSIAGVTGVGSIGPDLSDQESLAAYWGVQTNIGEVDCDLASSNQQSAFFASIVPGGSWSWALQQATNSSNIGYATVPSLGNQAVTFTTSLNDKSVVIEWVRGDNFCEVTVSLPVAAKEPAVALALATYINNEIAS
jgi:hypothetical protein